MRKPILLTSLIVGILLLAPWGKTYAVPISSSEPFVVEFNNLLPHVTSPSGFGTLGFSVFWHDTQGPGKLNFEVFDRLTNPPLWGAPIDTIPPGNLIDLNGIGGLTRFASSTQVQNPISSGFLKITVGGQGAIDLKEATLSYLHPLTPDRSSMETSQTISFSANGSVPLPNMLWPTLGGMIGMAFWAERRRRKAGFAGSAG